VQSWIPRIVAIAAILIGVVSLALVPFEGAGWLEKWTPKDDDAIARHYVDLLQTRQIGAIERTLESGLADGDAARSLAQAADVLTQVGGTQLKVVGFNEYLSAANRPATFTYETTGRRSSAVVFVAFEKTSNGILLDGLRVWTLREPLEQTNALTFKGKGLPQYAWTLACVVIALFQLWMLVVCAWAPYVRLRWLWMLLVFLGIGQFSMNWTTGTEAIKPVSIWVSTVGIVRASPYVPWILSFSLPLGAMLFFLYRRKLMAPTELAQDHATGGLVAEPGTNN
jgi:hypothetical protein